MADTREKGRGIDWVINLVDTRPSWQRDPKKRAGYVSPMKFNVRKCNICEKVWDFTLSNDFIDLLYYEDFPKYGLETTACLKCAPEKTHEVTNSKKEVRVRHHESNISFACIRKTKRQN